MLRVYAVLCVVAQHIEELHALDVTSLPLRHKQAYIRPVRLWDVTVAGGRQNYRAVKIYHQDPARAACRAKHGNNSIDVLRGGTNKNRAPSLRGQLGQGVFKVPFSRESVPGG